jgi:dTDP-4-dehydrorhamnose reductase
MSLQRALILLVGASGFLGSRLFAELSKQRRVIGTYYSKPDRDLVFLDTSDRKQVAALLRDLRPDILIDCGGMTRPDACECQPTRAYQVNVEGVANVAEFCGCKAIYFSTDYVFDGEKGQYAENDDPNPINQYGWTKREAERIALGARPDNVVVRIAGLYGESRRNSRFLASLAKPVIYRAVDCFSSTLLMDDVVQSLSFFWSRSGIYHLANCQALSRYEFAVEAVHILRLPTKVVGKPASEVYHIARRPRDSSLVSVRHNLPVRDADTGLQYLKDQLRLCKQ